jgi:hypothetical protein
VRLALLLIAPLMLSAESSQRLGRDAQTGQLCTPPLPPPRPGVGLPPHSTYQSDGWPPIRYQQDGPAHLVFASQREINRRCGDGGLPPCGFIIEACQSGTTLYMPNPCRFPHDDGYARLLCHEAAHLRGWPDTHGD